MLEKPAIPDDVILSGLRQGFAIHTDRVEFLPVGADVNTAIYRAGQYFVKLRSGAFDDVAVAVPALLHELGVEHIIQPLHTLSGQLWQALDGYALMVSPFVEGQDGYVVGLTAAQWIQFGRAVRQIHDAPLPAALKQRISKETFSDYLRQAVVRFQALVEQADFADPSAARLARIMRAQRAEIDHLVSRASALAARLKATPPEFVLCHSDLHAGNLHLAPDGRFYIVDWDTLIMSPREHDLMYAGGGLSGRSQREDEEELFYQGYGPVEVNRSALAYYRYERIIADIAAYCEQLLLSDKGGADREQSCVYFASIFEPGSVIDFARRADQPGPTPREPVQ